MRARLLPVVGGSSSKGKSQPKSSKDHSVEATSERYSSENEEVLQTAGRQSERKNIFRGIGRASPLHCKSLPSPCTTGIYFG